MFSARPARPPRLGGEYPLRRTHRGGAKDAEAAQRADLRTRPAVGRALAFPSIVFIIPDASAPVRGAARRDHDGPPHTQNSGHTKVRTRARGLSLLGHRRAGGEDRKSTRLNSSHANISYAVFCL